MADPRDLKFFPSAKTLVEQFLRKRIDTGKDGFIKDIKLYEDEPWLLPHVNNDLFNEEEWFYFVKRTLKSGTTPKRTVPGRGGSDGGTWTSSGSKEAILDRNKVVIGYKAELSYYKHVKGQKKGDTTGWCMTEYWLGSENDAEFQEIVLCYIRGKKKNVKNMSSYSSINRFFAPLEDIITMVDPSNLKFFPTDLKLVRHYLRNRVETGKGGFIKDIKLYEEEPWLLPHVNNDQFIEKEWFYFVVRTCGSRKKPKRTVRGRGGSKGGVWTTTGSHEKILDSNNILVGYKQVLSYYKRVDGKKKGDTTGWCMTEYWLPSDQKNDALFQEVILCNIRVKKNMVDQIQFQTETNNNIAEQPPLDKRTVSNAIVTGVGGEGCDSEFGQQNLDDDDYRFMFDMERLEFIYQQEPLMLPQDSIPPFRGQDLRSTMDQYMEEYAEELDNILDNKEEDDDDRTIQQQHPTIPLPLQVQDSGNPLEDEYVDQDIIFNLESVTQQREQERMIDTFGEMDFARLEMQSNLYFKDSYFAGDPEMSPWDNMMTNNNPYGLVFNTHGYEMQKPPVKNGVTQESSCFGVTQEQRRKRRKQC